MNPEPVQGSLLDAPVTKRAPYQGRTVTTLQSSRSGSDRVTRTHQKKAGELLRLIQARGPMTLNQMAEALGVPISSACSLRNCIRHELQEAGTVTVTWPTGRSTVRTRWRVK